MGELVLTQKQEVLRSFGGCSDLGEQITNRKNYKEDDVMKGNLTNESSRFLEQKLCHICYMIIL